jgi:Cu2+-exporting ATPase
MTQTTRCFHCGEPITELGRFSALIDGTVQPMCCPGCKAIAETIVASGLKDYYQHRTNLPNLSPQEREDSDLRARDTLLFYDSDALQKQFVAKQGELSEASFVIEGISCAACTWLIEKRMAQIPGVTQAHLNLSNHRLFLQWQSSQVQVSSLIEALLRLGYQATPFSATSQEDSRHKENKIAIRRLMLAGFGMMQMMMMALPTYADMEVQETFFLRLAQLLLALPVVLYSGAPFFKAAIRDLKARHLTMDVPVSLAILLAFGASIWSTLNQGENVYFSEVCMFIFFLLVGRYLEMRARHRMNRAGNNLLTLLPNLALRVDAHGQEQLIAASDIELNDVLRVKPGQTIAADGIVLEGRSSVDEAALTGEYLPVSKTVGSPLIGGTLNVESPLLMRVTATGAQAQISTIMRLLDRAQQTKPRAALIADRIASYFVLAVLVVCALIFTFWWQVEGFEKAFFVALSVLVVTCPCALALATPTALTAATAALRERGLLISQSHVLETLPQITRVVFDKTGTLTQGRLTLERIELLANLTEAQVLTLASGLEKHSTHPIARAFKHLDAQALEQIQQHAGQGIEGFTQGIRYRLGRADFAWPKPLPSPNATGQWLLLASATEPLAWLLLNDTVRSSAHPLVNGLKQQGFKLSLLTGDPSDAGLKLAQELGIEDVRIGMNPEAKLATVQAWQQSGDKVLMLGDGINDVPVLAGADLSLAVNDASDLAKTHADTLLNNGQLEIVLNMLETGHKTRRIIWQNHAWAIGYNLIALPAAAAGIVQPWQAAIGMSLSSLLVVTNAMRLLHLKKRN